MKVSQDSSAASEFPNFSNSAERENEGQRSSPILAGLIGKSREMNAIHNFINRVAESDSIVLIQGESGTGKEMVAQAIHDRSHRSAGPFVAVNCAALTESLLESELFGYERGAFTGAFGRSKGLIEHAGGGTFLLDELTELAPTIQAKLLRVIQERSITRLGGRTSVSLDVRFIAASNKNLSEEVKSGRFRLDLYYRLNVVSTTLPPLRERRDDIPLLADHFLQRFGTPRGRRVRGFSSEVEQIFGQHDWPGNVRELANVIQRALVLGSGPVIIPDDLPDTILLGSRESIVATAYRQSLINCRREALRIAIENSGGNLTAAAKSLGVHRNYLYRLMKSLGVRHAVPSRS